MRTIRLVVEFDGTRFAGWQLQANGLSVQEVVEEALARLTGEKIRLASSGRTDAGVHARGMTVHFRTAGALPLAAFREGINRLLPAEVAVREAAEAPPGFHARFSARGKWYRYTIYNAAVRSPLAARTSWHLRAPLDLPAMMQGAAAFAGRHDFAAFRAAGCDARETVREIFSVDLQSGRGTAAPGCQRGRFPAPHGAGNGRDPGRDRPGETPLDRYPRTAAGRAAGSGRHHRAAAGAVPDGGLVRRQLKVVR